MTLYAAGFFPVSSKIPEGAIGRGVIPAVELALKHINNSPKILRGIHLDLVWNDTEVSLTKFFYSFFSFCLFFSTLSLSLSLTHWPFFDARCVSFFFFRFLFLHAAFQLYYALDDAKDADAPCRSTHTERDTHMCVCVSETACGPINRAYFVVSISDTCEKKQD